MKTNSSFEEYAAQFWKNKAQFRPSKDEVILITSNLKRFFEVLQEWKSAEEKSPQPNFKNGVAA